MFRVNRRRNVSMSLKSGRARWRSRFRVVLELVCVPEKELELTDRVAFQEQIQ